MNTNETLRAHSTLRTATVAVTLLLLTVGYRVRAGGIDVNNPPQGAISDEWMVINLNGQKCGYAHIVLSRKGDVIRSQDLQTFKIGRGGQSLSVTQLLTSEEKLDGTPLGFTLDMDMAIQKTHQQGVIKDGKITLTSKQYDQVISETLDYPTGALMPWGLFRLQEEKGYAPGTEYEAGAYIPVMATNRPVMTRIKIHDREEVDFEGRKMQAIRVTQKMQLPGMAAMSAGMEVLAWMDPETHLPFKMSMDMMGMKMELFRSTQEDAVRDFEAPEAFMGTLVAVNKPIDRKAAHRLKLKLSLQGERPDMPALPKTGMQTPSPVDGRTLILETARQDHAALAKSTAAPGKGPAADFLQPNMYINSDDPAVKKMADQAAEGAKTAYAIAHRLRVFVSEKIEDKNLNVGFASASEVCRNMSGDCSEHAVLLAALGRAKGLPAQVACGLVYVPHFVGTDNVFGFHMWTQFWIDGQWVDFDAAQNESDCNPTHIAVVTDSLKDGGLGELAFAVLPMMARLKIEVLEVGPAP